MNADIIANREQRLLLQAALCSKSAALAAWEEWRAGVDLDGYLDDASFALLPLLYSNLCRHGVTDPWMDKLKGIYRRAWCENQVQFQDIEEVVFSFHRAGIPTLLLNGAALSLVHYQDNALRPIRDSAILVPETKAAQALALLTKSGWTARSKISAAHTPLRRGVCFTNNVKRRLEISWDAWLESRTGPDQFSWQNAMPASMAAVPTQVFDPTETLAHVLLGSADAGGNSRVGPIADAMAVLNSAHATVDWPRVIAQARKRRLIGLLKTQLEFLQRDLHAPIPEAVMKEVESTGLSRLERWGICRGTTGALPVLEKTTSLGREWLAQKAQALDRGFRTHVLEQALAKFTGVERLCARYTMGGRRDYSFSQDYVADRSLLWKEHLNPLRGQQNLQMLELGSFEGRSALWFLQNILTHRSSTITCVDLFPHRIIELRFDHNLRIGGLTGRVKKIKGRSQEILPLFKSANFDIVYVDAGHRAEEVAADAALSWPLVKTGGIIIFDDYLWETQRPVEERPQIAVDDFLARFASEVEILHKGYQVIVRKIADPR